MVLGEIVESGVPINQITILGHLVVYAELSVALELLLAHWQVSLAI